MRLYGLNLLGLLSSMRAFIHPFVLFSLQSIELFLKGPFELL
jgi:hypothetical protein